MGASHKRVCYAEHINKHDEMRSLVGLPDPHCEIGDQIRLCVSCNSKGKPVLATTPLRALQSQGFHIIYPVVCVSDGPTARRQP
jgi:hypothetical protein